MFLPLTTLLLASLQTTDFGEQFEVADGMEVSLWAESPLLYNPTAMAFDSKGRLWVTEAVNYRQWDGRNPGKHFEGGDRVVVLEDTNGDGKADKSTVFVQDVDLTAPLGICVLEDRVLVSCSPNLYEYRDLDGDLVSDSRTTLLTGFGGEDHDHGLHSFVELPGGDLLFAVGNAGPHMVTDADGVKLRSGSSYRGGGQFPADNQPGLVSDDGRVWTGGLVGRMKPDGSGLKIIAHNFRNNYEAAADSYGDVFVADNDDDGYRGCRTVAIVEGGNYGYFSANGDRFWRADRRLGEETLSAHWHQKDPGVMPLGTANGAGGPTGVAVYEQLLFPELFGVVLDADAGRSLVFTHRPSVSGAALELEAGVLIEPAYDVTGDRGHWFRPSDVAVAPDGSIFVADWFDPGVGGHAAGDSAAYGRILRIHKADEGDEGNGVDDGEEQGQLGATLPPQNAMEALSARGLWDLAEKEGAKQRFLDYLDPEVSSERFRAATYAAWIQTNGFDMELAGALAGDPSPFVRARVAASLRDQDSDEVMKLWLTYATEGPLDDRVYLECLGLGADGKEAALFVELLALGLTDEAILPLVWRLHPVESLPWLNAFARNMSYDFDQRMQALDAIAFMEHREAAEAMLLLALSGPEDLLEMAGFWVRHRQENDWRNFDLGGSLAGSFDTAEQAWQTDVIRDTTITDIDLDLDRVEVIWLIVDDAGNGKSYDWGNWLDLRFETEAGDVPLNDIPWILAESGWGAVNKGKDCNGGTLDVGDAIFTNGIGTHAPSRIGIAVPAGASRLKGACAADNDGTSKGSHTSIRFSILVERGRDGSAVAARQEAAKSGDQTAILELLESTEGALFLLQSAKAGELNEATLDQIGPLLRSYKDLAVRALASEVFAPPPGSATYPPIDELAALSGDKFRGQELYRGKAACIVCHTFDGLGGSIGPELSVIGDKYGRRGLMDALVAPSASIAFGFDSWVFTMKDGRRLTGAILADGDRIVLRDSTGARQVFDADEVEERVHQVTSAMPPADTMDLSAQDLADLVSFLAAPREQEPEFGEAVNLFNGTDLDGWDFQLPAGTDPASVWSVKDEVLRCEGQPIGYLFTKQLYTDFEIELDWRGDPIAGPGNSGVLLRVQEPHKVWPKSIEAQLQSGSAGDIWNIDKFPLLVDGARTSGRHTAKLLPSNERPLGEWNHYRIRVHGPKVTIEVNGEVQNTIRWAEHIPGSIALQSEGAVIEFRNIVLRPILNP